MTLKLYLDTRRTSKDGLCRLKISLSRRKKTAYIDLGIDLLPSQWDGTKVVNHPHAKWLNDRITRRRAEADLRLLELKTLPHWMRLTAVEARDALEGRGADTYSDYRNYLHHLNACLKGIGCVTYGKRGKKEVGEPMFPGISSYWARHSWATTAALLDIPKETIAAGLGHGGDSVTDIYIDFDRNKVDRANRKVTDFVLYEK